MGAISPRGPGRAPLLAPVILTLVAALAVVAAETDDANQATWRQASRSPSASLIRHVLLSGLAGKSNGRAP